MKKKNNAVALSAAAIIAAAAFGTGVYAADAAGNLMLFERFDGNLEKWTLRQNGATAAIVNVDASTKLQLKATDAAGSVAATALFKPPAGKYIIEYDMYFSSGAVGIFELLDGAGKPLVTVSGGLTPNTLSFATDAASASTAQWADATYNQITLVVDQAAKIVRCYWIDKAYSASGYNPRKLIAAKTYSGCTAEQLSFRSGAGKIGIVNIDEVKVYTPDIAIIGDSVSDGKSRWSNDPSTVYRLGSLQPDQTSPPNYQLGMLLGPNVWVANLGFGGSQSSELIPLVKPLLLEAGFKKIWLKIGLNDFNRGAKAEAVQKNMQAITGGLSAGGISPANIYICNCYGVAMLTPPREAERKKYNEWLVGFCRTNGFNLVDNDGTITDYGTTPVKPKAQFNCGDGVHLNKAGSAQMAQNIYQIINTKKK